MVCLKDRKLLKLTESGKLSIEELEEWNVS